ncbi:MAG TPA: mannose-1-phosphate guanylyltransferase [Bacteroidales bacterium]|nr:mannose-1-phosphate guanylyltransferase [Bacteroidales bacterium]
MNKNNYCVIMAGGVGARFWPISREEKPKQFLDFFGTGRSLIQMTYDRFRTLVPASNMLVVSNVIYKDTILEQLPELKENQILLEPARRNTAPCIAYAVERIKSMTDQANIIVAPSDHLILKEERFIDTIKQGLDFIEKNDNLLTLGIKPSRPETGYGYIQVGEGSENPRPVKTFTEKPNADLAKVFFETGEFFWNSGIFLWNLKTIDNAFKVYLPEVTTKFEAGKGLYNTDKEQEFINGMYPSCPSISIDYGIMEKAEGVYVLCSEFGWSDLGTWGSLYDLSEKDENQNATLICESIFYESKNNIVSLPKGRLAVIQDLDGYIVAESDDVLMICKRDGEEKIRQFVNDANFKYKGKYS